MGNLNNSCSSQSLSVASSIGPVGVSVGISDGASLYKANGDDQNFQFFDDQTLNIFTSLSYAF